MYSFNSICWARSTIQVVYLVTCIPLPLLQGPNYSISTACATANYAFVAAANHIRNGDADLMIVGGSEAPIIPVGLGGFVACRALSTRNDEPEKASR